jgi:hypothetical protein
MESLRYEVGSKSLIFGDSATPELLLFTPPFFLTRNNRFHKKRAVLTSRVGSVPPRLPDDGPRCMALWVRLNRVPDCRRAIGVRKMGLSSQLRER